MCLLAKKLGGCQGFPGSRPNEKTCAKLIRLLDRFYLSRKAPAVLDRGKEGFHHFGVFEVAVEAVEFIEPEIVAGKVGVPAGVRIALQISEVLH